MRALRKIDLRVAGWIALGFYAATILVHVLVLSGVIPLAWINGGRSATLDAQLPLSVANLVIAVIGAIFVVFASGIVGNGAARWYRVVAWVFTLLWIVGLVQQLLGTVFEQTTLVFLLLIGALSHLRIAVGEARAHSRTSHRLE